MPRPGLWRLFGSLWLLTAVVLISLSLLRGASYGWAWTDTAGLVAGGGAAAASLYFFLLPSRPLCMITGEAVSFYRGMLRRRLRLDWHAISWVEQEEDMLMFHMKEGGAHAVDGSTFRQEDRDHVVQLISRYKSVFRRKQ
ncbi:hypothetical protein ALCH109712_06725 [Alkalicoccus chagannorensis]